MLKRSSSVKKKKTHLVHHRLRTNVYVTHESPTIACAAIFLACREEGVKLPCAIGHEWWLLFDVDAVNFKNAAAHIKRLYYKKNLDKASLPLYKVL
jgi:hypothetical protein